MIQMGFQDILIVCPLVFLAGFIDTIAGGGGLISLPAYLMTGMPVHMAIGSNKFSSMFGTMISTYHYSRKGYIQWGRVIPAIACAFIGSTTGAKCALLIPDRFFKIVMLFVIPLTAAFVLLRKGVFEEKEAYEPKKTMFLVSFTALAIGFYDGIYGPGSGSFLILLLTSLAHLKLTQANGTAKAINFTTNVAAVAVYVMNGSAHIALGLLGGAFCFAGSLVGARCFDKGGAKIVKPVMIGVLLLFLVKLIAELFFQTAE